jgi:two-component system sensor histidine kinase GlrK
VLDGLIRDAVRPHELAMQSKAQRLSLELEKVDIEVDREKVVSIIDNLVGNAVKFTPQGGAITVAARGNGVDAVIDVIDSGPGVPAEEREAIFDSFFRGRAKASGRIEGTGLGLAIAREFTEAHGGRISVVACSSGAHFRVTLPRRARRGLAVAA